MFYKIVKDNNIVDVIRDNEVVYLTHNEDGRVLRANNGDVGIFGVLSSDSSLIYPIVGDDSNVVNMVECFEEDEYVRIKSEIDEQRTVIYEEPTEETVDISALKSVLAQQQAEQLMDLLQIITNDLSDELIVKYPAFVEKWEEGKSYEAGKRLSYDGCVYRVMKSIGTSGATPDNSTAYYTKLN